MVSIHRGMSIDPAVVCYIYLSEIGDRLDEGRATEQNDLVVWQQLRELESACSRDREKISLT